MKKQKRPQTNQKKEPLININTVSQDIQLEEPLVMSRRSSKRKIVSRNDHLRDVEKGGQDFPIQSGTAVRDLAVSEILPVGGAKNSLNAIQSLNLQMVTAAQVKESENIHTSQLNSDFYPGGKGETQQFTNGLMMKAKYDISTGQSAAGEGSCTIERKPLKINTYIQPDTPSYILTPTYFVEEREKENRQVQSNKIDLQLEVGDTKEQAQFRHMENFIDSHKTLCTSKKFVGSIKNILAKDQVQQMSNLVQRLNSAREPGRRIFHNPKRRLQGGTTQRGATINYEQEVTENAEEKQKKKWILDLPAKFRSSLPRSLNPFSKTSRIARGRNPSLKKADSSNTIAAPVSQSQGINPLTSTCSYQREQQQALECPQHSYQTNDVRPSFTGLETARISISTKQLRPSGYTLQPKNSARTLLSRKKKTSKNMNFEHLQFIDESSSETRKEQGVSTELFVENSQTAPAVGSILKYRDSHLEDRFKITLRGNGSSLRDSVKTMKDQEIQADLDSAMDPSSRHTAKGYGAFVSSRSGHAHVPDSKNIGQRSGEATSIVTKSIDQKDRTVGKRVIMLKASKQTSARGGMTSNLQDSHGSASHFKKFATRQVTLNNWDGLGGIETNEQCSPGVANALESSSQTNNQPGQKLNLSGAVITSKEASKVEEDKIFDLEEDLQIVSHKNSDPMNSPSARRQNTRSVYYTNLNSKEKPLFTPDNQPDHILLARSFENSQMSNPLRSPVDTSEGERVKLVNHNKYERCGSPEDLLAGSPRSPTTPRSIPHDQLPTQDKILNTGSTPERHDKQSVQTFQVLHSAKFNQQPVQGSDVGDQQVDSIAEFFPATTGSNMNQILNRESIPTTSNFRQSGYEGQVSSTTGAAAVGGASKKRNSQPNRFKLNLKNLLGREETLRSSDGMAKTSAIAQHQSQFDYPVLTVVTQANPNDNQTGPSQPSIVTPTTPGMSKKSPPTGHLRKSRHAKLQQQSQRKKKLKLDQEKHQQLMDKLEGISNQNLPLTVSLSNRLKNQDLMQILSGTGQTHGGGSSGRDFVKLEIKSSRVAKGDSDRTHNYFSGTSGRIKSGHPSTRPFRRPLTHREQRNSVKSATQLDFSKNASERNLLEQLKEVERIQEHPIFQGVQDITLNEPKNRKTSRGKKTNPTSQQHMKPIKVTQYDLNCQGPKQNQSFKEHQYLANTDFVPERKRLLYPKEAEKVGRNSLAQNNGVGPSIAVLGPALTKQILNQRQEEMTKEIHKLFSTKQSLTASDKKTLRKIFPKSQVSKKAKTAVANKGEELQSKQVHSLGQSLEQKQLHTNMVQALLATQRIIGELKGNLTKPELDRIAIQTREVELHLEKNMLEHLMVSKTDMMKEAATMRTFDMHKNMSASSTPKQGMSRKQSAMADQQEEVPIPLHVHRLEILYQTYINIQKIQVYLKLGTEATTSEMRTIGIGTFAENLQKCALPAGRNLISGNLFKGDKATTLRTNHDNTLLDLKSAASHSPAGINTFNVTSHGAVTEIHQANTELAECPSATTPFLNGRLNEANSTNIQIQIVKNKPTNPLELMRLSEQTKSHVCVKPKEIHLKQEYLRMPDTSRNSVFQIKSSTSNSKTPSNLQLIKQKQLTRKEQQDRMIQGNKNLTTTKMSIFRPQIVYPSQPKTPATGNMSNQMDPQEPQLFMVKQEPIGSPLYKLTRGKQGSTRVLSAQIQKQSQIAQRKKVLIQHDMGKGQAANFSSGGGTRTNNTNSVNDNENTLRKNQYQNNDTNYLSMKILPVQKQMGFDQISQPCSPQSTYREGKDTIGNISNNNSKEQSSPPGIRRDSKELGRSHPDLLMRIKSTQENYQTGSGNAPPTAGSRMAEFGNL